MSIFTEEHVGHANKALHTFPTRNDVPYVSHVATNAWPISQIFLLLVSIVVRSVVYTVVAFLYVKHYVFFAWRNVNGSGLDT